MKTPAVVCLIFLLSVIVYKGSHAEPYKYLQFVLQYARGSCYNEQKCFPQSSLPVKFTIHGVWPTNIYSPIVKCIQAKKQYPFNKTLITTSLQADLVQSWPSVETKNTNEQFWEHEYNTHGSCTAPAITQKAYFEGVHALWKQYDIYTVLDQKNINPGHSYSLGDFEAAVKTKIGTNKTPLILCKEGKLTPGSSTTGFISREIVIWFDHGGKNLVNCARKTDCNPKMNTTTTDMIYYV